MKVQEKGFDLQDVEELWESLQGLSHCRRHKCVVVTLLLSALLHEAGGSGAGRVFFFFPSRGSKNDSSLEL